MRTPSSELLPGPPALGTQCKYPPALQGVFATESRVSDSGGVLGAKPLCRLVIAQEDRERRLDSPGGSRQRNGVSLSSQSRSLHYLVILLLGALMLFPGASQLPLIDRDEPRFAQATHEMLQRQDFIIPYFNGEYRFDKPVMTYWLMMVNYGLFGQNELAARLHTILCALLVALVIYEFARKWFTFQVGLLGAIIWLTSFQTLIHGRVAVADMPMILAVAVTHFAIFQLLKEDPSRRFGPWFWVLYLSLAFGALVKGPIALISPVLTLLLFRFAFWRKPVAWSRLQIFSGSVICLLLIAAWGIPALIQTHGAFWEKGMDEHVIKRGMEAFNHRLFLPFYYFLTSFLSLFPWSGFLVGIFLLLRREWNEKNAFLIAWAAGLYFLFLFYKTQLPHYVMPAFPALALLLGQWLERKEKPGVLEWINMGVVFGLFATAALSLFAIERLDTFLPELLPLKVILISVGGFILVSISAALLIRLSSGKLLPFALLLLAVGGFALEPIGRALREMSPAAQLAKTFRQMPPDTTYYNLGFSEPSLIYYSHAKWDDQSLEKSPTEIITASGPRVMVFQRQEIRLQDYINARKRHQSAQVDPSTNYITPEHRQVLRMAGCYPVRVTGINTGRLSWVELEAWVKPR